MSTSAERMRRMRARRAAGLERGERPPVRDAGELLGPAVGETLSALQLGGRDAGAAALARQYAAAVDQAQNPVLALRTFGPLLLRLLHDLGATPAARAGMKLPERAGRQPPNQLAKLRAAHAQVVAKRLRGQPGA